MKQEDTKQKILDKALELFSARGYDCVSVGQIAAAVGIPNANYFSRLFKANVGLTPVKFRQEAGLDGAPDIE